MGTGATALGVGCVWVLGRFGRVAVGQTSMGRRVFQSWIIIILQGVVCNSLSPTRGEAKKGSVGWLVRGTQGGDAIVTKIFFGGPALERNSYLVDPASSHMLVSKIKPCMCKYKLFCTVKLRMAH